MKYIIFITFIFSSLSYSYSQEVASKKVTDISYLYAVPSGDFASQDIETGGFALNGSGFAIDSKTYYGNFFISSYASYQWNNLDGENLSNAFENLTGLPSEITGGTHTPFYTLIGPGYRINVANILNIDLFGRLGIVHNSFKPFNIRIYDPNGLLIVSEIAEYDSDFAFAYSYGTGINIPIKKDFISLNLFTNYVAGTVDTYLNVGRDKYESSEKMEFFQFGVGISIQEPSTFNAR